ncbi:MAG TPA: Do family serine endopeptidase [Candidatus Cybelea sp.]|nr:Do family serine endopeptidase [Candidatus Cybelea sp.]
MPQTRPEIELSFAPLVKRVSPAVVNIYTKRVVQTQMRSPLFDDPIFRRFFGDNALLGQPRQRIQQSLGSGVIVDPRGLIVTNNHVIEGAQQITVALADRREFSADVVLADSSADLAVLRISGARDPLPALELRDSDHLEVGDLVLAIGDPFGVGQTVTSGIISALGRTMVGQSDSQSFIQTDAAINPGNSGGALVTMDGRLAGINAAIYSRDGGSLGIGFAIPSNLVAAVLHRAQKGKNAPHPWLGASGQTVTSEIAASVGLDRPGGVLVNSIYPGGPAAKSGLKVGDVVVAVDGHEVFDPRALKFRIDTHDVGDGATLDVLRKGQPSAVKVILTAVPEDPPRDLTEFKGEEPFAGSVVGNLSPAFAEELGMDIGASGVIVVKIDEGTPSIRIGLRPGDIVESVNGADIKRVGDLKNAVAVGGPQWRIKINRDGKSLAIVVRG